MTFARPLSRRSFLLRTSALAAVTAIPVGFAAPRAAGRVQIYTHIAGDPGTRVNSHLLIGQNEAMVIDAQMLRAAAEATLLSFCPQRRRTPPQSFPRRGVSGETTPLPVARPPSLS